MKKDTDKILKEFPFMSLGKYMDEEYLGIIVNSNQQIVSMYIYNDSLTHEMKQLFLNLGDEWWWETNRKIPINIALLYKWKIFDKFLKCFSAKDFTLISGPQVSVSDFVPKRIKRRSIQLVKKVDW